MLLNLSRRPRRLRQTAALRGLVRENRTHPQQLILPLFVSEKGTAPVDVASMPGVRQHSPESLLEEARQAVDTGLGAVLLFGIPAQKDEVGSGAYAADGVVQRAVRQLKRAVPHLTVITDVCLCEYTSHGHCGIVESGTGEPRVVNDASVELLARTALSHAEAGADLVAPSDMMDGRVGALRATLDAAGHGQVPILSYAAKFASAFYGPFREAAESTPQFGDRRTYQMDPANASEALREVALDVEEGCDALIVKPGLPYLDLLWRIKERFGLPTAVYNVSGEYAMVKAAAAQGWLDEKRVVLEMLTGFSRAGADMIITYWAKAAARWLAETPG